MFTQPPFALAERKHSGYYLGRSFKDFYTYFKHPHRLKQIQPGLPETDEDSFDDMLFREPVVAQLVGYEHNGIEDKRRRRKDGHIRLAEEVKRITPGKYLN